MLPRWRKSLRGCLWRGNCKTMVTTSDDACVTAVPDTEPTTTGEKEGIKLELQEISIN